MAATPVTLSREQIRHANRGDLEAVTELDENLFEFSWLQSEFAGVLSDNGAALIVATIDDKVVGYLVYMKASKNSTVRHILRIAVHADWQQRTIGKQLVRWVQEREVVDDKSSLCAAVQDSNTTAQLFFKSVGFIAQKTLPEYYEFGDNSTADAYEMVYSRTVTTPKPVPKPTGKPRGPLTVDLKNRCSRHF